MRIVRVLGVAVLSVMLCACACGKKKGGTMMGEATGEGTIPQAEVSGTVLSDVYFAFDSSALSESAKNTLRTNARWMMDNPGQSVTVEGHCDERGTNEYNMALGERRAKSAYDFMRSLGVGASQMSTVSYGEEMPVDPGHTEAAWAKNRRAHFRTGR